MKAVEDLIKARQDLLKAQENLPSNVDEAAKKLSEKTGIDYFEALEIVGDVVSEKVGKTPTKQVKPKENWRSEMAKKTEGFGGSVRPTGLRDIKRRITNTTKEEKKHCYMAAYRIMKAKGDWVSVGDLRSEGIITKHLRNKRRLSACLPAGFVAEKASRGYRVRDLSEELA